MSTGIHGSFDDHSLFKIFCNSPKTFSNTALHASHRFLVKSVSENKSPVTKTILIKILMNFVQPDIKEYHFKRMARAILVELAICLVQDLIQNGPGRAETLELQLIKSTSGGAKVTISDPFADEGGDYDEDFLKEIDEIDATEFNLRDKSGATPDKQIHSGQGFARPFIEPNEEGSFVTPKRDLRKRATSASVPTVGPKKLAHIAV